MPGPPRSAAPPASGARPCSRSRGGDRRLRLRLHPQPVLRAASRVRAAARGHRWAAPTRRPDVLRAHGQHRGMPRRQHQPISGLLSPLFYPRVPSHPHSCARDPQPNPRRGLVEKSRLLLLATTLQSRRCEMERGGKVGGADELVQLRVRSSINTGSLLYICLEEGVFTLIAGNGSMSRKSTKIRNKD